MTSMPSTCTREGPFTEDTRLLVNLWSDLGTTVHTRSWEEAQGNNTDRPFFLRQGASLLLLWSQTKARAPRLTHFQEFIFTSVPGHTASSATCASTTRPQLPAKRHSFLSSWLLLVCLRVRVCVSAPPQQFVRCYGSPSFFSKNWFLRECLRLRSAQSWYVINLKKGFGM